MPDRDAALTVLAMVRTVNAEEPLDRCYVLLQDQDPHALLGSLVGYTVGVLREVLGSPGQVADYLAAQTADTIGNPGFTDTTNTNTKEN